MDPITNILPHAADAGQRPPTVYPTSSNLDVALAWARRGVPVVPACWGTAGADTQCRCGGTWDLKRNIHVPHSPKEVGKAPVGKLASHGISDATTNTATIDRWWRTMPSANVLIRLDDSGLLVVDPDSRDTLADARARGLDGGIIRQSRHPAFVFQRPDSCPTINAIKAERTPLDVLAAGGLVVAGTHATGVPVALDTHAAFAPAPPWAVATLVAKQAERDAQEAVSTTRRAERHAQAGGGTEPPVRLHARGMRRWKGELVEGANGAVDRSLSLFYLGLDLAECGASEPTIITALGERDIALGWSTFTDRNDGEIRYGAIATKAVAREIARGRSIGTSVSPAAASVPRGAPATDAPSSELAQLRFDLRERTDRLAVLEELMLALDGVLASRNLTPTDKVLALAVTRDLHTRASQGKDVVSLARLSDLSGLHKNTVSKTLDHLASDDPEAGAPFRKTVTRSWVSGDGDGHWISTLTVTPWAERPRLTLGLAAGYTPPKATPGRGKSPLAAVARWTPCPKHPDASVHLEATCAACGTVLGEQAVDAHESAAQDHLTRDPGHRTGAKNVSLLKGHALGDSGFSDRQASAPHLLTDALYERRAREAASVVLTPVTPFVLHARRRRRSSG